MHHRVTEAQSKNVLPIDLSDSMRFSCHSEAERGGGICNSTAREKPVKLILPYAPGGATDLIGRPWADKLSQAFGQQFVIDNRGGAGGMIGTEAASKSPVSGRPIWK